MGGFIGWGVNPGTVTRSGEQAGKQLVAALLTAVYSFVVTFALLKTMMLVYNIVPTADEQKNLDQSMHGEQAHSPAKKYEATGLTTGAKEEAAPKASPESV